MASVPLGDSFAVIEMYRGKGTAYRYVPESEGGGTGGKWDILPYGQFTKTVAGTAVVALSRDEFPDPL